MTTETYDRVQHFPNRQGARAALGDSTPGTFVRQSPCYDSHDWYRPYCFVAGVSGRRDDRYVRADGVLR